MFLLLVLVLLLGSGAFVVMRLRLARAAAQALAAGAPPLPTRASKLVIALVGFTVIAFLLSGAVAFVVSFGAPCHQAPPRAECLLPLLPAALLSALTWRIARSYYGAPSDAQLRPRLLALALLPLVPALYFTVVLLRATGGGFCF